MHITPQIPDGYDGPIKKLTCRVCKRIFYITLTDYHQLGDISYCYECSLIVKEEVAKAQEPQTRPASQVSPNQVVISMTSEQVLGRRVSNQREV